MHADAVGLHDGGLAVAVDDEPGEVVALAVDKPVCIVVGIVGNADVEAHGQGGGEAFLPEFIVDGDVAEGQHAHGDGSYLIMANGDEIATCGDDTHDVAFGDAVVDMLNGSGEHPGMEALEALFLAFL